MVLTCIILTQYGSVMDRQTDGSQTMAKMHEALHAVVHKNLHICIERIRCANLQQHLYM